MTFQSAAKKAREFRKDSLACNRPQHYHVVYDPTDPACDTGAAPYFVATDASLEGFHAGCDVVFSTEDN
jgi:hypothetical protein